MSSTLKLLKQGAEGKLYVSDYEGKPCLIKERFVKNYRLKQLDDQLTKERIRAESRAISRCEKAGILTPLIYKTDLNERKIYMEYYKNAITVAKYLSDIVKDGNYNNKIQNLCKNIGTIIGTLHSNDIIHGDLTTSNMLLEFNTEDQSDYKFIMIDFGLSKYSSNTEDKGVDLYVLERALLSTHSGIPELFSEILEHYKEKNTNCKEIILKYEEVRARGRKRTMVG